MSKYAVKVAEEILPTIAIVLSLRNLTNASDLHANNGSDNKCKVGGKTEWRGTRVDIVESFCALFSSASHLIADPKA